MSWKKLIKKIENEYDVDDSEFFQNLKEGIFKFEI